MKSGRLIGKVLIGFLLTGAALSIAILFMYRSIQDVSDAVQEAGKPNERLLEWKAAVNLIYEAENKSRSWRVSKNPQDLYAFDTIRSTQAIHLSRLAFLNRDSVKALALCDSLALLSEDRFDLLGEWITNSFVAKEEYNVLDEILTEMAKREKIVSEQNKQFAEKTGNENVVVEKSEKEKSFWQRILRKKNKQPDPVTVAYSDTIVKSDSLIPVVETKEIRKTIEYGQIRIESSVDSALREESRLLNEDQLIMSHIHAVSDQYEKLCEKESAEKLKTVSRAAEVGTNTVTRWTIIAAICIILFSILFIGKDISRNRKLQSQLLIAKENAERFAKTKEDFMAKMSHEIRNPLNVIAGFSAQLLKEPFNDKNKKQVEGISRSAEFLTALVNDILDISKFKSGKLALEKIPFALKDISDDLQNAFGTLAAEKGLTFTITVSKKIPSVIMGDPVRFRQVLFNLVSNALKFTSKGFIQIRFEQEIHHDGFKLLTIDIADTGIGIQKDKVETIFEEFEQADASITRKYGGTGLGLSITKALLNEMQGTIDTASEFGKGTTFTIKLPLYAGELVTTSAKKLSDLSLTLLEGKTILVCDDDPMNRMLASHLVQHYAGNVIEACEGKDVLEIISKQKVDLIITDLEMPDMNGDETIAEIRKIKTHNSIPIIAMTGKQKANLNKEKLDALDGFIQKPYTELVMIEEITRVLSLKKN